MKPEIFNFFTTLLEKTSGISYREGKEYLLESRLTELAVTLGYKTIDELYQKIKSSLTPQFLTQLIDALTTKETYFFRDEHPFVALKNNVLPELFKLKQKDGVLNIWSSACSTGQEPYSIAMLILEHFSAYLNSVKVNIYATDISISAIEKAKKGVYNQIEVNRGLPVQYLIKYFKQNGGYWEIDPRVKSMVKFEVVNLLEADKKVRMKFDLILCRYVLIYFAKETKEKVFRILWNMLNPLGYLLLGATELSPYTPPDMEKVMIGKTIFYKKKG
jgi:chemotaxis protein methyltransferase CheR